MTDLASLEERGAELDHAVALWLAPVDDGLVARHAHDLAKEEGVATCCCLLLYRLKGCSRM